MDKPLSECSISDLLTAYERVLSAMSDFERDDRTSALKYRYLREKAVSIFAEIGKRDKQFSLMKKELKLWDEFASNLILNSDNTKESIELTRAIEMIRAEMKRWEGQGV